MGKSASRLRAATERVLTPGEHLATTGVGWAAQGRPRVPLLFLARRQYWIALTDRRVLVFARRRGGPSPDDLVLGKRFSFFTLEKVHRHRPLFQIRLRGANDSRLILEFRPKHRALAAELAASLRKALPAPSVDPATESAFAPASTDTSDASDAPTATMTAPSWSAPGTAAPAEAAEPAAPPAPERDADSDTAAAFWGDR